MDLDFIISLIIILSGSVIIGFFGIKLIQFILRIFGFVFFIVFLIVVGLICYLFDFI